jgi:hypothetical protein
MSPCRNIGAVPDLEQQLRLHGPRCLHQYPKHRAGGSSVFITELLSPQVAVRKCLRPFSLACRGRIGIQMTYSIFARDGTSRIVLKRESREAAERKARELTDLGWFEVQIDEEVQIEEAECSGK